MRLTTAVEMPSSRAAADRLPPWTTFENTSIPCTTSRIWGFWLCAPHKRVLLFWPILNSHAKPYICCTAVFAVRGMFMNAYEIEHIEKQMRNEFRLPLAYHAWADIERQAREQRAREMAKGVQGLLQRGLREDHRRRRPDPQHRRRLHRRPAAPRSLKVRQAPPRFPPPSSSAAGLRLSGQAGHPGPGR